MSSLIRVNNIETVSGSGEPNLTASNSKLLDGFGSSQYLRSDIDQVFAGTNLTTNNLISSSVNSSGNLQADGTSYLASGPGQNRFYFRDGRVDCVNNNNSAWGVWISRASQYYFTDPAGNNALHYNGGWMILGTGASQGSYGNIVTSPNSAVGRLVDVVAGSYLEFSASGRAVGCTYFVSDERYKENIGITSITKEQSANLINSIQHKQFDWNDQNPAPLAGTHQEIGYTAQSLETVHTSFALTMSDGKKMVNSNNLTIHITHAIQHLMDKIDDLQAQIDALQ